MDEELYARTFKPIMMPQEELTYLEQELLPEEQRELAELRESEELRTVSDLQKAADHEEQN